MDVSVNIRCTVNMLVSDLIFALLLLVYSVAHGHQISTNMTASEPGAFRCVIDTHEGSMRIEQTVPPEDRATAMVNRRCCKLWPQGKVSYRNVNIPADQWRYCEAAMKLYESVSCVKFQRSNRGNPITIRKANAPTQCSSYLGEMSDREGTMWLGHYCFNRGGSTVIHEFGHALGLVHEQKRQDRDKYVNIQYPNIKKSMYSQFDKDPYSTTLDTPYDYCSIMHYGPYSFNTARNKITVKTSNPSYQYTIGYQQGLSFYDIKALNLMYKCSSHCPRNLRCRNRQCYLNKNCKCVCPKRVAPGKCETYGFNQSPPVEDPVA